MPKFIAHALTGIGIVTAIHPTAGSKKWLPLAVGAVLAVSPDFDYAVELVFNVQDFHRGFSHSLIFSAIVCLVIGFLVKQGSERAVLAYSLAYLSHSLLDCLTSTTGGVKIFYPFSTDYYNYGLTDLLELPIGVNVSQIFYWIKVETIFFLPLVIILLVFKHYKINTT